MSEMVVNMRLIGIEILRKENMCREIPIVLSALIMGCTSVRNEFSVNTGDDILIPAVSLLPNVPYVETRILEDSSEYEDWTPGDADVAMVADKGLYLSLGTDKEAELVKLAKLRNPDLKLVVLTNGCTLVGSADYHWLDMRNLANIQDHALEWMSDNGYPKRHRLCGRGLRGLYRDSEFTVVTTHYSVLYSCMSLEMKCLVVADVSSLDADRLSDTTFLICPDSDQKMVENLMKGRKVRRGFVKVRDNMQVDVVKMFLKFVHEKIEEDEARKCDEIRRCYPNVGEDGV